MGIQLMTNSCPQMFDSWCSFEFIFFSMFQYHTIALNCLHTAKITYLYFAIMSTAWAFLGQRRRVFVVE